MDAASVNNTRQSKIYITDIYLKHKKNMHDVSNAINVLDPNKDAIDKAICKGKWNSSDTSTNEEANKCSSGKSSSSSYTKLSEMFVESDSGNNNYATTKNANMGPHTSGVISTDIIALNREQHGVVSSAF